MQRMDKLRRSLRDSFRKRKDSSESCKPHQWQADEEAVRSGNCPFSVKYLGCVEVYESRGMQVCEEAMKVLRQSRRRPVRSTLFISGDGLRVVEDDTKGLIVDQTIEKVSFCAPDRNHERGFSYICRDGTTRRWMCHGFLAVKDSGERLSHAVGCAFASCLERKQRRERECGVTMSYDPKTSTFTRSGSFRVSSMTDSMEGTPTSPPGSTGTRAPVNTHAIERPHAPPKMLERQGSFRGFAQLAQRSPFKRQLSLRLNELPSNLQRTQPSAVEILANSNITIPPPSTTSSGNTIAGNGTGVFQNSDGASPTPPPRTQRSRLNSLPNNFGGTSLASISSFGGATNTTVPPSRPPPPALKTGGNKDLVSELCQQVTQGLSLLAAHHDEIAEEDKEESPQPPAQFPTKFNPWDEDVTSSSPKGKQKTVLPVFDSASGAKNMFNSSPPVSATSSTSQLERNQDQWLNNLTQSHSPKAPLHSKMGETPPLVISEDEPLSSSSSPGLNKKPAPVIPPRSPALIKQQSVASGLIKPNQTSPSGSIGTGRGVLNSKGPLRGPPVRSQSLGADPFDADWATPVAKVGQTPTNPFVRTQQTFQVSM